MTIRVHTYASEVEAIAAIEAIDTARPASEPAVTIIGPRGLRRLAEAGHVEIDRRTRTARLTQAGREAGLVLDEAGCRRVSEQPTKTWAEPIALVDGTFAVLACPDVAGVEVETRTGKRHTVPDDTTARTITAADRRVDVLEELPAEPIGGGKGRA